MKFSHGGRKMKDSAVVGIDLGGTNVRLALVSSEGTILSRWEWATAKTPDQAALVAALAAELTKAGEIARDQGWEIKSAGIGVPGRVLPGEGRVVFSPNIPALDDCRLIDRLALQVNLPPVPGKRCQPLRPGGALAGGRQGP